MVQYPHPVYFRAFIGDHKKWKSEEYDPYHSMDQRFDEAHAVFLLFHGFLSDGFLKIMIFTDSSAHSGRSE